MNTVKKIVLLLVGCWVANVISSPNTATFNPKRYNELVKKYITDGTAPLSEQERKEFQELQKLQTSFAQYPKTKVFMDWLTWVRDTEAKNWLPIYIPHEAWFDAAGKYKAAEGENGHSLWWDIMDQFSYGCVGKVLHNKMGTTEKEPLNTEKYPALSALYSFILLDERSWFLKAGEAQAKSRAALAEYPNMMLDVVNCLIQTISDHTGVMPEGGFK